MSNTSPKRFSRYERNGIIFLCVLLFLLVVFQGYIPKYWSQEESLSKTDLKKINEIKMQIQQAHDVSGKYERIGADWNSNSKGSNELNKQKDFSIEVNSASVADYERLYGIGKVLSQRIVEFRDKLGGFYSTEQIKDVWGVEDSVYENFKSRLKIKPAKINKININVASYEELTANPYFFSTLAKQILGYRTKVRPFETIEDVKKLYYIRDHPEIYTAIEPYISLN
jgi:competence ComEA-like helix-hairpin-helix protein